MEDQYLLEIRDQPTAAMSVHETLTASGQLHALTKAYGTNRARLVFVGMGSSNYAPIAIRHRLSEAGIPFHIYEAGELLHYELGGVTHTDWVIALSQSGESYETCAALEAVQHKVQRVIAITNDTNSRLAQFADTVIPMCAGREVGSTTKTFTNSLIALHHLTDALVGVQTLSRSAVGQLCASMHHVIKTADETLNELIQVLGVSASQSMDALHIIARGPMLAAAKQAALILEETTDLFVQGMAGGTFRHGPFELAGPEHRAILLAPSGATQNLLLKLAGQLALRGSRLAVLTDATAQAGICQVTMPQVNEALAPVLYILMIELLGRRISQLRGRTPGMMRQMDKVTAIE